MSKIADAIEVIQKELLERYGVIANVQVSVHRETSRKYLNKDLAQYIADEIGFELGHEPIHSKGEEHAWYNVGVHEKKLSIFYMEEV